MATGLVRSIYHRVKRVIAHNFAAGRAIKGHFDNKRIAAHKAAVSVHKKAVSTYKKQSALHKKSVKARVAGVRAAVKSVTKGNRQQRANQLRSMRKNSTQRNQLRRRVKFKTKMP